ncbi:Putative NAD(P)-dependent oxidoreductase EC-YbbO [Acidisarcina polymorpha]|uniref:NAD(P)-dependent oxidoreductase EC-YbbO n=1 Tax=Acidisarcina polymorpha TaxID=2211140 RepID=A0A2Z5G8X3_9BACT|nr:SDR family oxidoreductase [Acidisarcina polymorpha]AXC15703.1 Putative NAD(P)-dependent oxidoreductase EC-YbbO [Acidisarcina polymorpha]
MLQKQRSVLITGCSSGFGRASALKFLAAGWKVAASMRNVADWKGDVGNKNLLLISLDLDDPHSVQTAMAAVLTRFGTLDCLVNNAGRALLSVFESTPLSSIQEVFETNLFGPMRLIQTIIPHFRAHGGGTIVNVSSQSAIMPEPLMAAYNATKCALEGFSESLQYELAPHNIWLKLVEPGMVFGTNLIDSTLKHSQDVPVPSTYQSFVDQTMQMYMSRNPEHLATVEDVALCILDAAEGRTAGLHIPVGPDAVLSAQMRRGHSSAEYERYASAAFENPGKLSSNQQSTV